MKNANSCRILAAWLLACAGAPHSWGQQPTLVDSLDLLGATWTISGAPSWIGQTTGAHDGVDVAGLVSPTPFTSYEYAELSTVVNGPGLIRFWWKLDNTTNAAGLLSGAYASMSVQGLYYTNATANTGWTLVEMPVPHYGSNLVRWEYGRWMAYETGQDAAWVDEVTFVPTTPFPPLITNSPESRSVFTGGTARFAVGMDGTPPFYYQWRRNSEAIAGATEGTLRLFNVSAADVGSYDVVVTNLLGRQTSAPALLSLLPPISIPTALDAPNLVWQTGADGQWFGQTNITHDGTDAVQTGGSPDSMGGYAYLITTVNGPGTLSFWWKSEFQGLTFEITNSTGTVAWTSSDWISDWSQKVFELNEGAHTLIWSYFMMHHHGDMEFDSKAFLDEVVWSGGGTPPPGLQLIAPGFNSQHQFQFSFQSASGKRYFVEFRDALTEGAWSALYDVDGNGSLITVTDLRTSAGPRFYRVRVQ